MAVIGKNEEIRNIAEYRNPANALSESDKAVRTVEGETVNDTYAQASIDGVQYEVSGRAGEIAEWLQDMNVQKEGKTKTEVISVIGGEEEAQEEQELPWEKKEEDLYDDTEESIRRLERLLERLRKQRQKKNDQKKTKRLLVYNHKKISTTISGAKTLIQASNAVASANSNLSAIKRKEASGRYDENEIAIAKSHAMKMVRAARKKLRHIKMEKNQEKINIMTENGKRQDTKEAAVNRKEYVELKDELQELQKELNREEKRYKNMHRRNEDWELMQADMEYLKRKIELMRTEQKQSATEMAMQQTVAGPTEQPSASGAAPAEETNSTDGLQQMTDAALADTNTAAATVGVDVLV